MAGSEPDRRPRKLTTRALSGIGAALAVLAGVICYATLIEPYRVRLERIEIRLPGLPADLDGFRLLQISDLESREIGTRERQVAAFAEEADADLIAITGDMVAKSLHGEARVEAARRIAGFIGGLQSRLGTWFVEGHGERIDIAGREALLYAMEQAGVRYLEDEIAALPVGEATLSLVGLRVHSRPRNTLFRTGPAGEILQVGTAVPAAHLLLEIPSPGLPALFQIEGEFRFTREDSGIGITFNNRLPEGRDIYYRIRRTETAWRMHLSPHGTVFSEGRTAAQVAPLPGPWHRFRVLVSRDRGSTRVRARIWPSDLAEPDDWPIDCLDATGTSVEGGTFGVWGGGPGNKAFRGLRIEGPGGSILLDRGRYGDGREVRWLRPPVPDYMVAVASRIPPGSYPVAISHSPDLFVHTAALGWPLLLAGHTQGGQVRIPFLGVLTTDTLLGRDFAAGLFSEGGSQLYISRGVGTSRVPVRFFAPPDVTLVTLRPGTPEGS